MCVCVCVIVQIFWIVKKLTNFMDGFVVKIDRANFLNHLIIDKSIDCWSTCLIPWKFDFKSAPISNFYNSMLTQLTTLFTPPFRISNHHPPLKSCLLNRQPSIRRYPTTHFQKLCPHIRNRFVQSANRLDLRANFNNSATLAPSPHSSFHLHSIIQSAKPSLPTFNPARNEPTLSTTNTLVTRTSPPSLHRLKIPP